ncbi:hypothetical protein PAXINDRAFT_169682 [Paxillus involutus ATCC 200175]|uniref:Uncharacterized protein n=1 Tax=Paxillus involutus ATCC 200175 TaxID=664439 RepID=A0A0C9TWA2_PAXIN|nr:hypothetical protein PAXINDRAFT_169682 [Paxillus involutus ATCC 200175]
MTAMITNCQPLPLQQPPQSRSSVSFATPLLSKQLAGGSDAQFAFARVQGDVCLVQLIGQTDSGTPLLDIPIFRHEFVSIFRYSHSARVHPAEVRLLEPLDDHAVRYEEDSGTVFLAKDLMSRLKRIMDTSAMLKAGRGRLVPGRRKS